MSSQTGKKLKIQLFGESHGEAVGVVIDGLPAGIKIDFDELDAFLKRRAPGGRLATPRKEEDKPRFISGVFEGVTTGFPICAVIENTNTRSGDYKFKDTPRPSHADFTAAIKYGGFADMRGSGHFSGRLTAPICIAGGIAKQVLAQKGIFIGAHLKSVGLITDDSFPAMPQKEDFDALLTKELPVIDDEALDLMIREIEYTRDELDSVGGVIECCAVGVPSGLGDPMFDGIENILAKNLFGVPAVKGIEFGLGFESSKIKGSQNNDEFTVKDGKIVTKTNNCGGILGGITNGMPIVLRAAMKPTPSIAKKQNTVNTKTGEQVSLEIKGRHDPCVAVRAVPVIEAVTALTLLDIILED
ncbi:MAG: chorismate synthase [Oscillospiraceae bacterium]|nr:chorismate synthase [Oscillospiraceae bacterium]